MIWLQLDMYHFIKYVSFHSMVELWLKSHRLDVWPQSTCKSHVPFHTRGLSTMETSCFANLLLPELQWKLFNVWGMCVCVWWCRQCSVWRSVLCVVPQQVPTWTLSRRGHTQYSPCTFVSSALHSLKYAQWLYFIVMLCSSLSFEAFRTFCVHIVNSHLATVILFVHHVFRNFMHNESHKSI